MRRRGGGKEKTNDENVLWCFGYIERMQSSRVGKRVFEGECGESRLVGRPREKIEVWLLFRRGE